MTPPLLWLTWPSPVDEAVLGPVAAVLRSEEAGSTAGRRRGLEGSAVGRAVCRRGNAGAARVPGTGVARLDATKSSKQAKAKEQKARDTAGFCAFSFQASQRQRPGP